MLGSSYSHVPGAWWHSLMLSLCHGWHRHNVSTRSTWPAVYCQEQDTGDSEKTTKLISIWYNFIMQVWTDVDWRNVQFTYVLLCASLTMHYLSITSFSEKIGSGETHECNDGAPLFRLMDCSPGAILRDSGSVTRQPAIKLRTSNHHFILFGITIEFVFSPGPRIKE